MSTNALLQRLRELTLSLNNPDLTEEDREAIENEIYDIEYEMEEEDKAHYGGKDIGFV